MTILALAWRPGPHATRTATVAAAALAAPVLVGRPVLLAVAAPLLVLLAGTDRHALPRELSLDITVEPTRCLEGEPILVRLRGEVSGELDSVVVELVPTERIVLRTPARLIARPAATATGWRIEAEWSVEGTRWGRHQVGVVALQAVAPGRMLAATAAAAAPVIEVFPPAPTDTAALVPADLLARIGEHVSRSTGEGWQFAGVRAHVPGDRLRRIHWPATTRKGRLHVTTYASERAADVVIAVDAYSDVRVAGGGTLDRELRAAAALSRAYLAAGDRVGVLVLGGWVRWLAPGGGARQWYAVAQTLLGARREPHALPELLLPRAAVPAGALVILLTPLLEEAAVAAVGRLSERGHAVVVVDVLAEEPAVGTERAAVLARRLWRLDREALAFRIAARGVPVIGWDSSTPISAALRPLSRRPLTSGLTSGRR